MKKLYEYTNQELDNLNTFDLWDLCIQDERDKIWDKIESNFYPDINTIFDTLDNYRKFCIKFGRPYDEKNIYNEQSLYWTEYNLVIDKDNKIKVQNYWKRDEA